MSIMDVAARGMGEEVGRIVRENPDDRTGPGTSRLTSMAGLEQGTGTCFRTLFQTKGPNNK
jgi:hypothetical protein